MVVTWKNESAPQTEDKKAAHSIPLIQPHSTLLHCTLLEIWRGGGEE